MSACRIDLSPISVQTNDPTATPEPGVVIEDEIV